VRLLRRLPRLAAARDVRRLALPLAFAVSVFYALFSGFEVPVQRSLVLVAGATLALARRRPLRARSALAAAAFLVLAARPAALFDAGAQMSFAASAALLSLRRDAAPGTAETRGERLRRALHELLATSAAATCATAPIAATHIGVIAPAGLVANLLFVPWTGVMLLPAALLAAALAAAPGEGALRDVLLALCAQVGDLTCAAVEHLAAWVPDLPPSGAPGPLLLLACAALAIGAARAHRLWARLACAALSCLALSLSPLDELSPAPPRAVFFDVGQGDATLVQGRNGAVLVDAGLALPDGMDLGRSVVLPGLAALGVRHLDVVIVTHGDADHRGGIPAVLRGVPVGALWLPVGAAAEAEFRGILEAARARGVPVREVAAGDPPARVGDLTLTPLWPPRGVALASRNDRSLVVRVEAGGAAVLLPGDIEAGAEEALVAAGVDLRSDILKLAHHGSRTSTTPAFLGAVRPRLAIASAPCVGRFGMPHPEVVQRLEALPIAWGWTGREGALLVALGPAPEAHAFAAAPLRCAPGRRRDTSPRASWAERPRSRGVPRRRGPGRPVDHAKHCDVVRQVDHRVRPGLRTRRSALDTVM
jgi:competence protein ComEC